ncbi:cytochrome P450 4B1-like [Pseudophryne corroboree]|uniref:cytochrome P450 4B1-like n=1 Tax=Pseudophryne corroboree TaxID=495146 RepID=UPI0030816C42
MDLSVLLPVPVFPLSVSKLCRWAVCLGLFYLLFKAFKLYLNWRKLVTAFQHFPGPDCHWLYGNAREFLKTTGNLELTIRWAQTYTYGFPLWLGKLFAALIITHPDYAKAILSRQDPKDDVTYRFVIPWIGEGLLITSGEKWFHLRKLLTPAFHYEILKPYVKLMGDATKTMLDKWERRLVDKKPVEISNDASSMTVDSIMRCAFSYHSNCQMDSENPYVKAVYDISYLVDHRFRNFIYHNDLIYYLSPHGLRFRRALKIAHDHTDRVIKQRKEALKSERELDKIRQKRHLDFLDILLCTKDENGTHLSDKEMRSEVDAFMFAGHHTTASAISWIIYCMSKYPEYQERCYEEIREVLGDRDTVEWEDLGKMTYTATFIKETLRLYPPVPGVARKLSKPITFCDGRSLPEGSMVILSLYCVNRCPSTWKDPEVFDPSRFSADSSANRHPHAFIPFSAGPRNCIGQNFAMNELKTALALTLQRFQILPAPDHEPEIVSQVVLSSLNGIYVNLKKRGD